VKTATFGRSEKSGSAGYTLVIKINFTLCFEVVLSIENVTWGGGGGYFCYNSYFVFHMFPVLIPVNSHLVLHYSFMANYSLGHNHTNDKIGQKAELHAAKFSNAQGENLRF
jgi:hypothetical protein